MCTALRLGGFFWRPKPLLRFFFLAASFGTGQSALVDDSRQIRRGSAGLPSDHVRPARSSVTNYEQCRRSKSCKFGLAFESTRNSDSFLSRLSSSYGARRGSLVLDGYRDLRRRTFHSNYSRRD